MGPLPNFKPLGKIRIFLKKGKLVLFWIYGRPTFWKVSEKSNEQIPRKVRCEWSDERMDEQMDEWTGLNL